MRSVLIAAPRCRWIPRRSTGTVLTVLAALSLLAETAAQNAPAAPPADPAPSGPTFDVISIKPSAGNIPGFSAGMLPGGGYRLVNGTVRMLLTAAYPGLQGDPEGLPAWASADRYDVTATVSLPTIPTADERRAMMLALLASRFKLSAHFEMREQPAFDLVLARSDGRLGPGLTPSEVDCAARAAAQRAAADAVRAGGAPPAPPPAFTPPAPGTPPPCGFLATLNLLEGDVTMATLATLLRTRAGRHVVDKTGLTGNYRIRLEGLGPPVSPALPATPTDDTPSIFTAVQEQLGLKLEASRAMVQVLVVDRIERPTEN